MKILGIVAVASLALAPALVSADEQKSDQSRPAPGPVASQNDEFGGELTPDVAVPAGIGLLAAGIACIFACGDSDGGSTTTTTSTTTTQ
jgi:hypothetical protein